MTNKAATFDELATLELGHILADCKAKMAALPERLKSQFLEAVQDGRRPYAIEPKTAICAALVVKVIEAIDPASLESDKRKFPPAAYTLKQIARDQRRACSQLGREEVALNSDQLAALIEAAGIAAPKEDLIATV